jgi:uncharacterized membrane protein
MPIDVSTEILIKLPPEVVSRFAADPDNAPKWYVNIKSVDWETPQPLRVGSLVAFVAQFLGRRMAYTYEIVTLTPGERLVMRTAEGPFPMETHYHGDPTPGGGTRMTLRNVGSPSGFSKFFAPLMGMAMRRATTRDLLRLKHILECGSPNNP